MARDQSDEGSTRRAVLEAAGAATMTGALSTLIAEGAGARPADGTATNDGPTVRREGVESTFPQSVASGGPTPTGVILWTRVAETAYAGDEPLYVQADADGRFEDPDVQLQVPASGVDPSADYAVSVDLDGRLAPDATYRYRFVYDGDASRVGRCRTLPNPDASPDSLKLAVASCNNYLHGYYGAFAHVADEDVDYLLHLGDFVYEYAGNGKQPGRGVQLPSGKGKAWTLADFRHLHETYRSDELLQRALEAHTLVHTWDDHEVVNDRWWNYEEDAPETASHPRGGDPEFMRKLYVRGIEALMEFLPLRVHYDPEAEDLHDRFRLYRSFRYGDLAELFVTDERFYRSPPPGDASTPPSRAADDADRTMLGRAQREWLVDGLVETDARWKVWANEVLNAALRVSDGDADSVRINYDAWDGYRHERRLIMDALARNDVANLVTLTGDMHTYLAAYLERDYEYGTTGEQGSTERVGVEFMTPAISSDNLAATGDIPAFLNEDAVDLIVRAQNPHVEWFNSSRWGYTVVEFTPEECLYTAYGVDRTQDSADADRTHLRTYRVPAGTHELQKVRSTPATEVVGSLAEDAGEEPVDPANTERP